MNQDPLSRRQFLVAGGAASAFLMMPRVAGAAVGGASLPIGALPGALQAASIGFVDTVDPLSLGMAVVPGTSVRTDAAIVDQLLRVTAAGVHPSADGAFPPAALDAIFRDAVAASYPFFAYTHTGGSSKGRVNFVAQPDRDGLRFTLFTPAGQRSAVLTRSRRQGLREGTYLLGLDDSTWNRATKLADTPAQRSLVVRVCRA